MDYKIGYHTGPDRQEAMLLFSAFWQKLEKNYGHDVMIWFTPPDHYIFQKKFSEHLKRIENIENINVDYVDGKFGELYFFVFETTPVKV